MNDTVLAVNLFDHFHYYKPRTSTITNRWRPSATKSMATLSPRFLFSKGVVSQPANTPPVTSFLETHPGTPFSLFLCLKIKFNFSINTYEKIQFRGCSDHTRGVHDVSHSQRRVVRAVLGTTLEETGGLSSNSIQFESSASVRTLQNDVAFVAVALLQLPFAPVRGSRAREPFDEKSVADCFEREE